MSDSDYRNSAAVAANEQFVQAMFGCIARRYDIMNRVLSLGFDVTWRRQAARAAGLAPGMRALDVATGTGDLALALAKQVGSTGEVVGIDFSAPMLAIAGEKASKTPEGKLCRFLLGNALELPFADHSFDCATIGFALRNVKDIKRCLAEMMRVVKPGGRVVSLELSKPVWWGFRHLYYLYFYHLVPVIGRLGQGVDGPYTYLPHSLTRFPNQDELAATMREVGLARVRYRNLTGGIVAIHVGEAVVRS